MWFALGQMRQPRLVGTSDGAFGEHLSTVGQPERATQDRVVALFRDELGYHYLGDWTDRSGNSNIEEGAVSRSASFPIPGGPTTRTVDRSGYPSLPKSLSRESRPVEAKNVGWAEFCD